MKRPGYREAVEWLACNDDNEWLKDDEPSISVTAAFVQDLYDVPREKLFAGLRRAYKRHYGSNGSVS